MDLSLVLLNAAFFDDEEAIDVSLAKAMENGHQEENLNAGYHCDPEELNLLHPFWAGGVTEDHQTRVTFGQKILAKPVEGHNVEAKEEDVDFVERGDRALFKASKIVEASFGAGQTIIPILLSIKDEDTSKKVGETLLDVISHLEKGKTYSFNNCSSLRVKYTGTNHALNNISRAYTIFQYFTGSTQLYFPTPIKKDEITCKTKPRLVRQASRSIYCCQR
tara:strand:- start:114 stop:773 length:660 start_codon:yes stop_codon:yes gene_type:complete